MTEFKENLHHDIGAQQEAPQRNTSFLIPQEFSTPSTNPVPEAITHSATSSALAKNIEAREKDLDFYINAQLAATHDSPSPPRSIPVEEAAKDQIWGSVDPRTVWPSQLKRSDAWRAEKMAEIKERGGRKDKKNFGVILTAQVRKERMEKFGDVHSTDHWVQTDEDRRVQREMFGIEEDLSKFVPAMRDGVFGMMEKDEGVESEEERRKRKGALKFFPFGGSR